jgi:putative tryptophan/tyrosine transport system substrate-binding protein
MTNHVRRREFITLLGGAAAVWPLSARAQQAPVPVIGYLSPGPNPSGSKLVAEFRRGLAETGYVEGKNVSIEFRAAQGQYDRLPALAAELVQRRVSVLVATGAASMPAAKAATTTIPIVFSAGVDPVAIGLVASLNRPGGNVTGVTNLSIELGPKRLELLHEIVPTATSIAFLVNPTDPAAASQSSDMLAAARTLGLQVHILSASTEGDFDTVFATMVRLRAGGLLISNDTFLTSRSERLAVLTVRHAVPAIFHFREFAEAGGLMSYGGSNPDTLRIAGTYTGRILKGEKPADLPVQQATRVELIINMKTAKALGITFPITLLGRADEVIE